MSEPTLELASVYKGWDQHHHLLREAVRPLSADQLSDAAQHDRCAASLSSLLI